MNASLIFSGIITFLSGGAVGAFVNFWASKKRIEFEAQKFVAEIEEKRRQESATNSVESKEKIIDIVLEIDHENSLTMNYIMEEKAYSNIEIHDRYLQLEKRIRAALVLSRVSYEEVIDDVQAIYGLSNRIWGLQQNYFGFSKDNSEHKDRLREELIGLFKQVSKHCSVVLNRL